MTEYFDTPEFQSQDVGTEFFDPAGFSIHESTLTQHIKTTEMQIEPTEVIGDIEPAEEKAVIEHFELAQGSRRSLPEAELNCYGRVVEIRSAQPTEFDRSKFIKFSSETFPDLEGRQLEFLSDVCLAAHRSEEFFLSVSRDQWVRTSITSDKASQDLFSPTSIVEGRSKLISSITIHSNVLPRDPFWTKVQATRNEASKRMHFPCTILKDALHEGSTLMQKLLEWREKREECEIGQHGWKRSVDGNTSEAPFRLFWEIRADVKPLKELARGSDGIVWLVTWRGGKFVRKDRRRISNNKHESEPRDVVDIELNVVEKLSHPHIVYSFGVSYAANRSSLFMEYMQNDLFNCIVDRVRLAGEDKPPFSHQDSVDILLQFAKAMAHMHNENVVHGDLKSLNVLISKVLIVEGVTHYLVKVADFGSAQFVSSNSESTGFKPGAATTKYAAPEVLKMRVDKNVVISFPKKLDVYSFGIVAFEVLTGEEPYCDVHSQTKLKKAIIEGTLRPPLRAECQKDNFLHEERLLSLIESCWHGDPSKRPSFSKIVNVLNSVRVKIQKPTLRTGHRTRKGKSVDDTPCAFEEPAPEINAQHISRFPLQVLSACTEGRSKSLFNFSAIFERYASEEGISLASVRRGTCEHREGGEVCQIRQLWVQETCYVDCQTMHSPCSGCCRRLPHPRRTTSTMCSTPRLPVCELHIQIFKLLAKPSLCMLDTGELVYSSEAEKLSPKIVPGSNLTQRSTDVIPKQILVAAKIVRHLNFI